MKRLLCVLLAVSAIGAASAKGLLPCMVYRRGLTNEQIDQIFAAHPDAQLRMTTQDWRAMKYQLFRFDCMTNYVEMIGNSNDCARVLLRLHDDATTAWSRYATASNMLIRTQRSLDDATERAQAYADAYTDATNRAASIIADYASVSNRAAIAEARAAQFDALRAYLVEQRDKAILQTTKAIYQALIDRIDAGGV